MTPIILVMTQDKMQGSAQDVPLCHLRKKIAEGAKKSNQMGPEGTPNFLNQKTTKSDFSDVVLAF